MFKIGDFSKICQVPIKTLRYWDEVDLLKPAHIDRDSGYRYYDINQLGTVNRIIAYKGLGLRLDQVRRLLEDDLPASEIRGMLRLKQAELQQDLEERATMLARVETRLNHIEQEGKLPEFEAAVKSIPEQRVAAVRQKSLDFVELVDLLHRADTLRTNQGKLVQSPLLAVFHDSAFQIANVDVEVGFVVSDEPQTPLVLDEARALAVTTLPKVTAMAATIHKGHWRSLPRGYGSLGQWIAANGYEIIGPGREIFHHINWDAAHHDNITELQFPVKRAQSE